MRNNHIIKLLDEKPLSLLSDAELADIAAHTIHCSNCRQASEAANISAQLVRERAAEVIEAPPFFKTRVMATLRERQLSSELSALERMWRSAGALVSVMATLVVILISLTIFSSSTESAPPGDTVSIYSPEYVLFERDSSEDNLAYDQVLGTVYDLGEGDDK